MHANKQNPVEVIEAGDRALLFTQFAEWGHLLQGYLKHRWKCEVPFLHGSTSKSERQAMVDRFQEDPRGPQLFLLSLKDHKFLDSFALKETTSILRLAPS